MLAKKRGINSRMISINGLFYSVSSMFEEPAELSQDLEWMLHNSLVDEETPGAPFP